MGVVVRPWFSMVKASFRTRSVSCAVLLVAVTLAAYIPAMRGGFIWDDDSYVTRNQALRTWAGLRDIWLRPKASPQYYPLVFTTFWLEGRLWGHHRQTGRLTDQAAFPYHMSNVLLHGLSAVVLWRLLRRLGLGGAYLAAMIFALHPVHVESVAWITERKNVLSGVLYLLCLWACLRFWSPEAPLAQQDLFNRHTVLGSWWWYSAAFGFFLAALLSKTVTASLPAAVLVLMWWRRERFGWQEAKQALLLIPFFALGAVAGLHTTWMEQQHVGATGQEWSLTGLERVLVAGRALWFYIGKLLWPGTLTFIYPRWHVSQAIWWQYLFPLAALAAIVTLFLLRRRLGKGPLAAVLFFVLTLAPALGFFNVYPMRYSYVADHFQYLASIGPTVLFAGAAWRVMVRLGGAWRRRAAYAMAPGLILLLGAATWQQGYDYGSLETLWTGTLRKNPSCFIAYNNLGVIYSSRRLIYAEVGYYQKALELNPGYTEARYNLANALDDLGDLDAALVQYHKVIQEDPTFAPAHNNLAILLVKLDRRQEAIAHWRQTVRLRPQDALYRVNLAEVLLETNQYRETVEQCTEALRIEQNNAHAHYLLGSALLGLGQAASAVPHLEESLRLDPNDPNAQSRLRSALGIAGKPTTRPS